MVYFNFRLYFDGINELFFDYLFLFNVIGFEVFFGD